MREGKAIPGGTVLPGELAPKGMQRVGWTKGGDLT